MKFRPCIDIHNGAVKQIVGGTLSDYGNEAHENFVSKDGAAYFANMYKEYSLSGGHVIMLNSRDSDFYEQTKQEAIKALKAFPQGMHVGGGINPDNAQEFLDAGASHVIVTSYVFKDGQIDMQALENMVKAVGKEKLVLDLSCKLQDDKYLIVTDRWQKFTDVELNKAVLDDLSQYCDEFLVHAADVEGLSSGIEPVLVSILRSSPIPVTYAGGIHSMDDIDLLRMLGESKVDFTIGSALDIFGGYMKFDDVVNYSRED
ncbi:MAG: phosphoribosylformimino-5-aminoimidazole carboxamide ribotide isomerase [Lachnospiraceae bacterium]|nr:phosphoribosylformimino-5-aminoimidazole carboxamide ribotide isomerase [Lachnospiraceae bacterium]